MEFRQSKKKAESLDTTHYSFDPVDLLTVQRTYNTRQKSGGDHIVAFPIDCIGELANKQFYWPLFENDSNIVPEILQAQTEGWQFYWRIDNTSLDDMF